MKNLPEDIKFHVPAEKSIEIPSDQYILLKNTQQIVDELRVI